MPAPNDYMKADPRQLARALALVFEEISQENRAGAGYFSQSGLRAVTIDGTYNLIDVVKRALVKVENISSPRRRKQKDPTR